MSEQLPLGLINGNVQELPSGDFIGESRGGTGETSFADFRTNNLDSFYVSKINVNNPVDIIGTFDINGDGINSQQDGIYVASLENVVGTTNNPLFTAAICGQVNGSRTVALSVDGAGYLWGWRGHSVVTGNVWQSKVKQADNATTLDGIGLTLGNNWTDIVTKVPHIKSDGLMEVGRYIDFHTTNSTADYDVRFDCNGADTLDIKGLSATGLTVNGDTAWTSGNNPKNELPFTTSSNETLVSTDSVHVGALVPLSMELPINPSIGDWVRISDYIGSFSTNNVTVLRNGENIMGLAEDMVLSTDWVRIRLEYVSVTYGWLLTGIQ